MNKSNQERRLAPKLVEHWDKLVQHSKLSPPLMDSLNPKVIWECWRCCLHLKVVAGAKMKFHIVHIGEELGDLIPLTHERLTVRPSDLSLPYYKLLQLVEKNVELNSPRLFEGVEFFGMDEGYSKPVFKYRSCLLPFSSISGKVNDFVLGMSYKKLES